MIHHFATLFDINYLSRGLCLAESLSRVLNGKYQLYVLALDDETVEYFKKNPYPSIITVRIADLELKYPELLQAKSNRSLIEYYFTISPFLPLYLLENYQFPRITSLDADLYFYSSPEIIFHTYHKDDILITPHDFSSNITYLLEYGIYNVSFQSFPNTENAIRVLSDWKDKCIQWCYDTLDKDTQNFADQKYLNTWSANFPNIQPIYLKTAGRAPWNIRDTNLRLHKGKLMVDNNELIYYHFHHLRFYSNFIDHGLLLYGVYIMTPAIKSIYRQYLKNLFKLNILLQETNDNQILRFNYAKKKESLLTRIWEQEAGILRFNPFTVFFSIRFWKRAYYYANRKMNGLFN